jgi:hypothetical protein
MNTIISSSLHVTLLLAGLLAVGCSKPAATPSSASQTSAVAANKEDTAALARQNAVALRQRALRSQMDELELDRGQLVARISGRQQKIFSLEARLGAQQEAIRGFQTRVEAYMMNHKMAIACVALGLGGTAVAMDSRNEFSDEAKMASTGVAVLAALWALGNLEEIVAVADQLVQADAHMKRLKADASILERTLHADRAELNSEAAQLETLSSRLQNLRAQFVAQS